MIRGWVWVLSAYAVPVPLPWIEAFGQADGPRRLSFDSEQVVVWAPLYFEPLGNGP